MSETAPPPQPTDPARPRRARHKLLSDLVTSLEEVRQGIDVFLDDPEQDDTILQEADDEDIFNELDNRDIEFCVWDDDGDVIAGKEHKLASLLESDARNFPDLDEAIHRLRRGDLFEALIHIERAIPALDGLHDAVRNLQGIAK